MENNNLSYKIITFWDYRLKPHTIPEFKIKNNGYDIYTSDQKLADELIYNEEHFKGSIKWNEFKTGKGVLISQDGRFFGCTIWTEGIAIYLEEIIDSRFENEIKDE